MLNYFEGGYQFAESEKSCSAAVNQNLIKLWSQLVFLSLSSHFFLDKESLSPVIVVGDRK